jgi:hypothetical protein
MERALAGLCIGDSGLRRFCVSREPVDRGAQYGGVQQSLYTPLTILSVIASLSGEVRDKLPENPVRCLGTGMELDFRAVCGYDAVKTTPHNIAAFETATRPTRAV